MKESITNNHGLPGPLVTAIRNDDYDRGDSDITVTELIAPPRQVALKRKHAGEITEDASDRIWSLVGQVGHAILERAGKDAHIVEKRLYATSKDWKVGGKADLYLSEKAIIDYKFTTVYPDRD